MAAEQVVLRLERLARVQPDPHTDDLTRFELDRVGRERSLDRHGALHRSARTRERQHEPVATSLHLDALVARKLGPYDGVVGPKHVQPSPVADSFRASVESTMSVKRTVTVLPACASGSSASKSG